MYIHDISHFMGNVSHKVPMADLLCSSWHKTLREYLHADIANHPTTREPNLINRDKRAESYTEADISRETI